MSFNTNVVSPDFIVEAFVKSIFIVYKTNIINDTVLVHATTLIIIHFDRKHRGYYNIIALPCCLCENSK